ncbi:MAG: hypothetical protein WCA91_01730 [Candidatus Acidiferrales bacterium]
MSKPLMVVLFLLLAGVARADGSSANTLYDVNGSMTLSGTSSTETIDYSFILDINPTFSCGAFGACVVGPVETTSSGPLGTFASNGIVDDDHGQFVPFLGPDTAAGTVGTEIDMYFSVTNPPTALPSNLYYCLTTTCVADFGYSNQAFQFNVANQFTATLVPEPGEWIMLLAGIAALYPLAARRRQSRSIHSDQAVGR